MKNFLLTFVILVLVICGILCRDADALAADQSVDKSTSVLRGDQLSKSVVSFGHDEYGPVAAVIEVVTHVGGTDVTTPHRVWYNFSFYTHVDQEFLQTIGVYDGNKNVEIIEQDSADCSTYKMLLIRRGKSEVYLVTAEDDLSAVESYADPAPQIIAVYKLRKNNGSSDAEKTQLYFGKIAAKESSEKVCTPDDVYSVTLKVFKELVKERKLE